MATTAQKIDFLFFSNSGYGWTESYYYIPGGATGLDFNITQLRDARLGILASDCSLQYLRFATDYIRAPLLRRPNNNNDAPMQGQANGNSGPDFVAVVERLGGNPGGIGRIFVRGVPESQYIEDQTQFDAVYGDLWRSWEFTLRNNGVWGIRTSVKTTKPIKYPITNLLPRLPRGYTFQYTNLPLPTVGNWLRVQGETVFGYNGLKQVTALDQLNTTVTVGGAAPQQGGSVGSSPTVYYVTYNYNPIISTVPERVTRRSAGKFFGQRRGRRSTSLSLRR